MTRSIETALTKTAETLLPIIPIAAGIFTAVVGFRHLIEGRGFRIGPTPQPAAK